MDILVIILVCIFIYFIYTNTNVFKEYMTETELPNIDEILAKKLYEYLKIGDSDYVIYSSILTSNKNTFMNLTKYTTFEKLATNKNLQISDIYNNMY